jgi:hypothetical protein
MPMTFNVIGVIFLVKSKNSSQYFNISSIRLL